MIKYVNSFDFYECTGLIDNYIQIDTFGLNSLTILNLSIAGIFIVNNQILNAGERLEFSGKELQQLQDKVTVNTAWIVGYINYSFLVIQKRFV